jgi:hypothetical protein
MPEAIKSVKTKRVRSLEGKMKRACTSCEGKGKVTVDGMTQLLRIYPYDATTMAMAAEVPDVEETCTSCGGSGEVDDDSQS